MQTMHSQLSLLQSSLDKMVEDNEKERQNRLIVERIREQECITDKAQ